MESYCNMPPSNRRQCRNQTRPGCHSCDNTFQDKRHQMQNMQSRTVEVECSCKVIRNKNCHKADAMEHLGKEFPLVMSYVPWQQWGELYDTECGLMQGTIFKDLNYVFCGVRC